MTAHKLNMMRDSSHDDVIIIPCVCVLFMCTLAWMRPAISVSSGALRGLFGLAREIRGPILRLGYLPPSCQRNGVTQVHSAATSGGVE